MHETHIYSHVSAKKFKVLDSDFFFWCQKIDIYFTKPNLQLVCWRCIIETSGLVCVCAASTPMHSVSCAKLNIDCCYFIHGLTHLGARSSLFSTPWAEDKASLSKILNEETILKPLKVKKAPYELLFCISTSNRERVICTISDRIADTLPRGAMRASHNHRGVLAKLV